MSVLDRFSLDNATAVALARIFCLSDAGMNDLESLEELSERRRQPLICGTDEECQDQLSFEGICNFCRQDDLQTLADLLL